MRLLYFQFTARTIASGSSKRVNPATNLRVRTCRICGYLHRLLSSPQPPLRSEHSYITSDQSVQQYHNIAMLYTAVVILTEILLGVAAFTEETIVS